MPPVRFITLLTVMGALALALGWVDGPWKWAVTVLQIIVTVAMLIFLVWFVRKQRDDYWRERGKDPKHPEL